MRTIAAFAIILAACVACVTIDNFKRFGTYTYEGVDYDVYTADRDDSLYGYDKVRVLVPKGVAPVAAAVIAECNADNDQTTCDRTFAAGIDELLGTTREEGGMY